MELPCEQEICTKKEKDGLLFGWEEEHGIIKYKK